MTAPDSTSTPSRGAQQLHSARLHAEQEHDAQRSDVPYRWPRGPEAPNAEDSKQRRRWIGAVILVSVLCLALIGMMLTRR
jgi:hypothetical protein